VPYVARKACHNLFISHLKQSAFWARAYEPGVTDVVSAPTTGDTPVNADFFRIGQRGHQHGSFGQLFPMQSQTGGGYYRCQPLECTFCSTGITVDEDVARPELLGTSCGNYSWYVNSLDLETFPHPIAACQEMESMEQLCCPPSANEEL